MMSMLFITQWPFLRSWRLGLRFGALFCKETTSLSFPTFFPLLVSTRWFAGILFVRIPSLSADGFFQAWKNARGGNPHSFIHTLWVAHGYSVTIGTVNHGEHWWIQKKLSFNRDTPYWFSLFGFAFWVGEKSKRVWIDMNGYMDLYGHMFIRVYIDTRWNEGKGLMLGYWYWRPL